MAKILLYLSSFTGFKSPIVLSAIVAQMDNQQLAVLVM